MNSEEGMAVGEAWKVDAFLGDIKAEGHWKSHCWMTLVTQNQDSQQGQTQRAGGWTQAAPMLQTKGLGVAQDPPPQHPP